MAQWARPKMDRTQISLFSPTLDAMIGEDHPVGLFDEVLAAGTHRLGVNTRGSGEGDLPPGLYFCRVTTGETLRITKLGL